MSKKYEFYISWPTSRNKPGFKVMIDAPDEYQARRMAESQYADASTVVFTGKRIDPPSAPSMRSSRETSSSDSNYASTSEPRADVSSSSSSSYSPTPSNYSAASDPEADEAIGKLIFFVIWTSWTNRWVFPFLLPFILFGLIAGEGSDPENGTWLGFVGLSCVLGWNVFRTARNRRRLMKFIHGMWNWKIFGGVASHAQPLKHFFDFSCGVEGIGKATLADFETILVDWNVTDSYSANLMISDEKFADYAIRSDRKFAKADQAIIDYIKSEGEDGYTSGLGELALKPEVPRVTPMFIEFVASAHKDDLDWDVLGSGSGADLGNDERELQL